MWFSLLKVDIDFDENIQALGQYSEGIKGESESEARSLIGRMLLAAQFGREYSIKDLIEQKIRINHKAIFKHLNEKLGRKPTESEVVAYVIRVIMHEGTHAGMGSEQDSMAAHQAEYGAYTGQFPESSYMRLRAYLKHPATRTYLFDPNLGQALGIPINELVRTPDITQKVQEFLGYIDGVTEDITRNRDKIKERLTRLELTARQKGEPMAREWPQFSPKEFYNFMLERYGQNNKDLVDTIASANGLNIEDAQKMSGAVTTTSAPSMFNNKAINRRRKKKRKDE